MKKIVREELRYRGFIISDDLGMKALTSHFDADLIPVRALQVGVDFLLYCNEFDAPPRAMAALEKAVVDGKLSKDQVVASHQKIIAWKRQSLKSPDPLDLHSATQLIGHADHYKLSQAIANGEVPPGLVAMN